VEGNERAAREVAQRLGTSDRTAPGARVDLARLTLDVGLRPVAEAILDSIPDEQGAVAELLRSRVDADEGRYTVALDHARRATALSDDPRAARQVANLEGRLATLRPDWRPDLGPARRRFQRMRGRVTPGRILHIVFASLPYNHSGYSVRSQLVGKAQRRAGLDPHFATRAGFPRNMGVSGAPDEETVDGVPYYRLAPSLGQGGFQDKLITETARAAVPLVDLLRPAALQPASNHIQAQIALAMAEPLGIPVVYEVRGFWEETWASHPWHATDAAMATDHYQMMRDTETRSILAADAVVTLSETMRLAILERGLPADRIVVIPNAVEIEAFRPVPRDRALARELGLEAGQIVLGYISSFNPYEGIRYLLEAAATLRGRGRPVRVLLVGDGVDLPAIRETAARLGLDDGTLVLPGRVPHDTVLRYYSLIDVFVVPRTADRVSQLVTPLKPYEAMAMERPVVVSDLPALREVVQPGETGLTFRAEDADDLAAVLETLIDDPALRLRLGSQAREWILANRTWSENGRRYRELYERLGAV
jgi:glycosyltransferase involved in cell wall biosynthesis